MSFVNEVYCCSTTPNVVFISSSFIPASIVSMSVGAQKYPNIGNAAVVYVVYYKSMFVSCSTNVESDWSASDNDPA
jgi:hypothetical protein